MLFGCADVKFEDVRLSWEEWPEHKSKCPWEVLPLLEIDGQQISQSLAILRYLGEKFGLAGKNEFEMAKCDEYVEAMVDVRIASELLMGEDKSKQANQLEKLQEEVLPNSYASYIKILKQNGTGYLVGNDITYADIYVVSIVDYITEGLGSPAINRLQEFRDFVLYKEQVFNHPEIKRWVAERPKTPY